MLSASDTQPKYYYFTEDSLMNNLDFIQKTRAERWVYDSDNQQNIFQYTFVPTFKESANLDKSVYFTNFLIWTGKVRELALAEIGVQLADDLATGDWGLVTNWADLKIIDEVFSYQPILAIFRIGKVFNSVIPLTCEFYKIVGDELKLIAVVGQETTWVEIIGHGKVKPAMFPDYLEKYLDKTKQRLDVLNHLHKENGVFSDPVVGKSLFHPPVLPSGFNIAESGKFVTTLEDANLVGNVYYANYFIWQGRLRDGLIYKVAPQYFKGNGHLGAFVCTHAHLDYLRDAMPFDTILVTLSFQEIAKNQIVLRYEYFRELDNGNKEKLAIGQHTSSWVTHTEEGKAEFSPIPDEIMTALLGTVDFSQHKISA